ncbi:MAG: hypothetical protein ABS81_06990 [Pseudonocardia sp. SCN 72-86]|nr:MAG: hypothetical protein ABS81_06990 [Pseudonocardia sp. SCN 72-86]
MTVHVFTGPTLTESDVRAVIPNAHVHGPIGHGDLLGSDLSAGDAVVIIDGAFYGSPAIRHKEILQILHDGVTVVGAAGTGAQRAAELDTLGMVGSGTAYRLYRNGTLDGDDEVAVLHGSADDGYPRLSEPMVDIRCTVSRARRRSVLSRASAGALIDAAKNCWFGDRTIERLLRRTTALSEAERRGFAAFWEGSRTDVKGGDARRALRVTQHLMAAGPAASRRPPPPRTWWLQDWMWQAETDRSADVPVSRRDVLTFAQIFASDFPAWYRSQLLDLARKAAWVHTGDVYKDGRTALRDLAVLSGLSSSTCGPASETLGPRLAALLLPAERQLAPTEQLVRAMVRSYRVSPSSIPIDALTTRLAAVPAYPRLVEGAAAAIRLNQALATRNPAYVPGRVADEKILDIAIARWDTTEESTLLAQFRDRGFAGASNYVRSARPFAPLAILEGIGALELSVRADTPAGSQGAE